MHSPGFAPSIDPDAVADAVARLGIHYPVVVDAEHEIWQRLCNLGWPARYLFNQQRDLFDYHYGEGGYADTEIAIQELLGLERGALSRSRRFARRTSPAPSRPQSEDVPGPYSGPYEAGGVWAVLEGQPAPPASHR